MIRRSIVMILCVAMLQPVGCQSYWGKVEVPVDEVVGPSQEHVLALTTKKGEVLEFDAPGADIKEKLVVGTVQGSVRVVFLKEVQRVWLRRKKVAVWKTIGITTAVTVGSLLVVGIIVSVIALATKNSCPFVYSWDGEKWVFDAEPYGGAVTKGLERDDYAELQHLAPDAGVYKLRVTNEVPETQCTNLMQLLVVDHDPGVWVAPDESGTLHTLRDPQPPLTAVNRSGQDLKRWLESTDRRIWEPLPGESGEHERQEIVMTFRKPPGASQAKLLVNAATGQLGARVIREFLELHGRELPKFYARIDTVPAARRELFSWLQRDALYRLEIEIDQGTGWRTSGVLPGEGPLIAEHRVIPLDLSGVEGDRLRIRIRPAVGFWALNSFRIDYSVDQEVQIRVVAASRATDSKGTDLRAVLRTADDRYWEMPRVGDAGFVEFPAPQLESGRRRTVFLHSRGYYKLHVELDDREAQHQLVREIMATPGAAVRFAAARLEALHAEAAEDSSLPHR